MRGWFAMNKVFNDPMCEKIDVDQSLLTSELELPYNLWWGIRFINNPAGSEDTGIFRLYGRLTYTENSTPHMKYTFNILASDLESSNGRGTGTSFSSHSDHQGLTASTRLQDTTEPGGNTPYTYTKWARRGAARSPVDLNFVRGDLSVVRYDYVKAAEFTSGRLVAVPWWRSVATASQTITHLPRE
jgi:hypothetical protein